MEAKVMSFFSTWAILGIGSFAYFFMNKNAAAKRKVYPWFVIGSALLFTAFVMWISDFNAGLLWFLLPAVIIISVLNIKFTKFCESCGRTVLNSGFYATEFCPKCGAKFNK